MEEKSMTLKEKLGLTEEFRIGTTSSSLYLGSPTFDRVPFHIDVKKKPALGLYVLVERDSPSVMHYGRIIEGTEDNPRADPSKLQQNQAYQIGQKDPRPSDQSPHVTRVMQSEVLGEIHLEPDDTLSVKEPGLLPQTGKAVYELPPSHIPWLLSMPDSPDGGFHIGKVESGDHSVPFILPMEAAARHIIVAGKTGVGKSYAVGVIIEELHRHGIPVVVFDVLGDTIKATEDLRGHTLRAGENYHVPYSVIGINEFLNFVPNLTREQSELVAAAYDTIFSEALNTLDENGTISISLDRLMSEIQETAEAFGQAAVGTRAIRRVTAAVNRSRLLTTKTEEWLSSLADKPITNIFIGHLGQSARNLIVGATARMLQLLRRRNRIPPLAFILDEAHLFLPAGHEVTPSTVVLREMVRTARHDAIGIILVTQSPAAMDKQILLTCNTRLVFALDQEDLKLISGTMGDLPEEMINRIPKQAKGIAIVSSGMDIMRHPARVRIRERKTREGAPTPNLAEEVKQWREQKRS
jgi:nucleoside-triphosphatase THEP1